MPRYNVLGVGVSALTIYNWEQAKSRPRKEQLASLVAVRGLGKRQAQEKLEALNGAIDDARFDQRGHVVVDRRQHHDRTLPVGCLVACDRRLLIGGRGVLAGQQHGRDVGRHVLVGQRVARLVACGEHGLDQLGIPERDHQGCPSAIRSRTWRLTVAMQRQHVVMALIVARLAMGRTPELIPMRIMRWIAVAYFPFYFVDWRFIAGTAIAAAGMKAVEMPWASTSCPHGAGS